MDISANIRKIKQELAAAQIRSTKAKQNIKLLAVSKTKPIECIHAAMAAGQFEFGENRVQELLVKQELIPDAKWHLIGHLQTNKVRHIIGKTELIHSLDSINLADEIEKRSAQAGIITKCLVQLNIANEATKSGIEIYELTDFIDAIKDRPHIQICGLMTIGPVVDDPEEIRPIFSTLRILFEEQKSRELSFAPMQWLSMGISNDFAVAVEEGANIVRVGSAIFGERNNYL